MPSIAPQPAITLNIDGFSQILRYHVTDLVTEAFLRHDDFEQMIGSGDYGNRSIPIGTEEVVNGGRVRKYRRFAAMNGGNVGNPDWNVPIGSPDTAEGMTSILLQPRHLSLLECNFRLTDEAETYITNNPSAFQAKVADAGIQLARDRRWIASANGIADHRAILGYLSEDPGAPTDNTTENRYEFTLSFAVAGLCPGVFQPGVTLHVCAAPVGFGAIDTLRNYTTYVRVLDDPTPFYDGTTFMTVPVAMPYTAATKAAILAQITAMTTTDCVTPWGGATTGVADLPNRGPNYGLLGLRFWFDTDCTTEGFDNGTYAEVTDCGVVMGASDGLTTYDPQNGPTAVLRNQLTWAPILCPRQYNGGGGAFQAEWIGIMDRAHQHWQGGGMINRRIVVNPLVLHWLSQSAGMTGWRQNESGASVTNRIVREGNTGYTWVSPAGGVTPVEAHCACPPDYIFSIADNQFVWLQPSGPEFRQGSLGGIFSEVRNASGAELRAKQATLEQYCQLFPAEQEPLKQSTAIRYGRPGTDADL